MPTTAELKAERRAVAVEAARQAILWHAAGDTRAAAAQLAQGFGFFVISTEAESPLNQEYDRLIELHAETRAVLGLPVEEA